MGEYRRDVEAQWHGVELMWDLALDVTSTFAVGDTQAVAHNCPVGSGDPTIYEKNASHIFDPEKTGIGGRFGVDTPENLRARIETAADPNNLQGIDRFGVDVYAGAQSDGSQLRAR